MPNCATALKRFKSDWFSYETLFDYAEKINRIKAIEGEMSAADFWDNQEKAQQIITELKTLKGITGPIEEAVQAVEDAQTLIEMAEDDDSIEGEVVSEIDKAEKLIAALETKALLSGKHDGAGAIVTIYARDGGTDANDWAEMLLRMYSYWAANNDFKIEMLDRSENEEAGINNASVAIRGPMAYGYLKGEQGIHRLVRISPFNSEGKRQTSFAAVDVAPEISDEIVVDINESDVKEDTYRAQGAGGQHVNKTDSAVRLTHVPTGVAVACQAERSQHKNRATAWKMLRAKIARIEEDKREAEQAAKYKEKPSSGFGAQIRNYFLHPDQRVKDARTGYSVGNFHHVMDGEIEGFIDSYLRWRVGKEDTN